MEPRSPGQSQAESEEPGADWNGSQTYDRTSGGGTFLSGSDPAAEPSGTETEAGPESQATEAVSLLQSLRLGGPEGRAASRLGGGATERRRAGRGWSEHRTDHRHAGKRSGVSERDRTEPEGKDLSCPSGAAGLYPQGQ